MVTTLAPQSTPETTPSAGARTLVVTGRRIIAEDVLELTLSRPDGGRLPDWAPGAHLDLVLPDGITRQYSLCGDRWDAQSYTVAVRRDPEGRGGSLLLHDRIGIGDRLEFAGPRNNFRLVPASRLLFVAGGIGITPFVPMIAQAAMLDLDWRLLYLGRRLDRLPYLDDLAAHGDRVIVHASERDGHADLAAHRPEADVQVYACGPERLLDAMDDWAPLLAHAPRVERFTARSEDRPRIPFEVVAARSGVSTLVEEHETVVSALARLGVDVLTSCAQGVCGTCETDVLEGTPDHRDSVLDGPTRDAGTCMMPCVSRCLDHRLVLDA